ncbi:hypothetical protein [Streptomyces sp. NPDC051561]|uniref:hypothetical protein n=1 Tax=Streptomyces sp. NPDC051561 TaxID=3365658 RepID=UPI0037BC0871
MSLPPDGFGPPPPAYGPPSTPYGTPQPHPHQTPQPHPYNNPAPAYGAPAPPPPGPDFLAADKHRAVVIDSAGVSFEANGRTIDFGWRDLSNVQFRPSPAGQMLMVAVILPDGRFFECVVDARKAQILQRWLAEISYVISVYRPH